MSRHCDLPVSTIVVYSKPRRVEIDLGYGRTEVKHVKDPNRGRIARVVGYDIWQSKYQLQTQLFDDNPNIFGDNIVWAFANEVTLQSSGMPTAVEAGPIFS